MAPCSFLEYGSKNVPNPLNQFKSQSYSSDCSVYTSTKELIEGTVVTFGPMIGVDSPISNPIAVDIENYEGIDLEISLWDSDVSLIKPYEQVCIHCLRIYLYLSCLFIFGRIVFYLREFTG